ncbi:MAG TPA: methyltransferase domain-containing protein [Vicinamibacterales bacterium]
MTDLVSSRRAYAQTIATAAGITTPGLVEALATVQRERFLRPGPWLVIGAADAKRPPQWTADDDPAHVYQDASVAIDPDRQLFNGAPSFLAKMIDNLSLVPGSRVLHVGAGLGYYSALMAHITGPTGRVVAVEVDLALAAEARRNLASMPWVEVRHNDGTEADGPFDAILVNAGVTHPQDSWLDALASGGRLLLPLTVAMPGMGASIGKGVMLMIRLTPDGEFVPEVRSFVAIYSAIGLRDATVEASLGQAMRRTSFPNLTRLRRDPHPNSDGCWLHIDGCCLSMEPT